MDQSSTFTKLLRVLQFRKHIKELTTACKRINKDGCYEFVTAKTETLSTDKKSFMRSKKRRNQTSHIQPKIECITVEQPLEDMNNSEHLSHATPESPANLSMIISQSYKPLHVKSTQFNKNTIAVTKDTTVKVLYKISNWVFIEIPETGKTGFIPIYCLHLSELPPQNNIHISNKPRQSIINTSTPPSGRFISSIGPQISTKAATYTRQQLKEESVLSRQISNISLHIDEHDAYGTLNLTPCKNLSFSILDPEPVIFRPNNRLRVIENYQRQFIGDISVLESEVVTLVNTIETNDDWKLVRRGDGKQGYIPKHIVIFDRNFT